MPRTATNITAKKKHHNMSILTTWNPIREMENVRNRVDRLFGGRSLVPWTGEETISASEWSPLVDVSEDDKEFIIKADLPEVKKEDVHVTVEDGTIRITGERKFEKEEKGRRYHRIECSYGNFERSFVLPEGAKTDKELKEILTAVLEENLEHTGKALNLSDGETPYVILVVGVNGVGKTTTIGKLANWLVQGGFKVVIGAADTFRAAAVDQVATWAERAGATLIRPKQEGQDPASVAFETVDEAIKQDADIAIIDTAGRLQNKADLMHELDKIRRVIEKQAPISEVLLVLDATTGQNGLAQAKAFAEVAKVSGVVLTKLDGTAKGGIVYSIQRELQIPVKLVGVGEGIDDFAFFDAKEFANGLVN